MIQSNLNPDAAAALSGSAQTDAMPSPTKKLTKKQLKKLSSGEALESVTSVDGTTPAKKTPKPRKPKKEKKLGELNNSMSSCGSQADLSALATNGGDEMATTMSRDR